ncbi:unnamed protein product, partial [Effrenium voratum]
CHLQLLPPHRQFQTPLPCLRVGGWAAAPGVPRAPGPRAPGLRGPALRARGAQAPG